MEALGISGKQSRLVDDYLLDAGGCDHAERVSGGGIRRQDDGLRFCRRGIVAVEKLITALCLALYGKFGGCGASDGAGQPEKCSPVADLGLDLDLAQRLGTVAGADLAAIQRHFDLGSSERERIGRTTNAGLEYRV